MGGKCLFEIIIRGSRREAHGVGVTAGWQIRRKYCINRERRPVRDYDQGGVVLAPAI